jgi:itaconyl-CoA hydratase
VGLVTMRTRGTNERGETVIEFHRLFMAYRRGAPEVTRSFPEQLEPARN